MLFILYIRQLLLAGQSFSYNETSTGTSVNMSGTGSGNLTNNYNCLVFDIENYSETASQSTDFKNLFTYIKTGNNSNFNGYEMIIIVTMSHSISVYNLNGGNYLADLYKYDTYDYISPQLYTQNTGTTNEYCGTGLCMWTNFNGNTPTFVENLKINPNFTTYGLNMILPSINLTCLYNGPGSNNNSSPANLYFYQSTDNNTVTPTYTASGYHPIYGTYNTTPSGSVYTSDYTDNGTVDFFNTIFGLSDNTLGGYAQWVNGTLTVNGTIYS